MAGDDTNGATADGADAAAASDAANDTEIDADAVTAGDRAGAADQDQIAEAQAAMEAVRRSIAEAPAEVVVVNHAMGLYELAAIHLSAEPPDLPGASLAIDAVASLVDGLGDRLGPEVATLRDALVNIRLAFVQIKSRHASAPPP